MRGRENSIMCPGKEDKLIRGAPIQLNSLACQHVLITNSIIRKGHSEACKGSPVIRDESNSKFQLGNRKHSEDMPLDKVFDAS